MAEAASTPQRSRSAGATSGKVEKEKRKRSRVTPEQLVHLERFFVMDRSPTAARRKEISDMLGMQERQTQIWFQNRRAKAKLLDGKKGRCSNAETPPDTPPDLTTGYEAELHNLLHEDEPVTIIPCTDLSVGTWRRIATTVKKHDLVAYLCDAKRCLTWFIQSSGYGFKMEIPFDIIVDAQFTNTAPGSGLASIILSQPPTFYLESFSPLNPSRDSEPVRYWKKCADWTEDQQATKVLRHDLIGSAVQLAHVLRHLPISYSNFSETTLPHHISHSSFSANCGVSPSFSPQDIHQRPYSAGSVNSQSYEDDSVVLSFTDNFQPPASAAPIPFGTPSPPLTTPFYPVASVPGMCAANPYNPGMPVVLGMPGSNFDVPT